LLHCICWLVAHSDGLQRCASSVALGAKRTCSAVASRPARALLTQSGQSMIDFAVLHKEVSPTMMW